MNRPALAGFLFFSPAAGWLFFYIFYWQMHFPLLYLAAALCGIPAIWAAVTLLAERRFFRKPKPGR